MNTETGKFTLYQPSPNLKRTLPLPQSIPSVSVTPPAPKRAKVSAKVLEDDEEMDKDIQNHFIGMPCPIIVQL